MGNLFEKLFTLSEGKLSVENEDDRYVITFNTQDGYYQTSSRFIETALEEAIAVWNTIQG